MIATISTQTQQHEAFSLPLKRKDGADSDGQEREKNKTESVHAGAILRVCHSPSLALTTVIRSDVVVSCPQFTSIFPIFS